MAFIRWAFALLLVVVAGLALWLWQAPPALVRIGAGYTAKVVCSGVFVSGRAAEEVLQVDVQAPGHPLLRLMRVAVDREAGIVRADLAGFAGGGIAVAREGTGCAGVPDGDIARARAHRAAVVPSVAAPALPWPQGEATAVTDPGIQGLLADAALAGPGMRALVVVQDGAIVAERYAPGFDSHMPLQGWSMTKTVNAVLFGMVARERRIGAERAGLFDVWRGDARAGIAIADLLSMSSGLAFDEGCGHVVADGSEHGTQGCLGGHWAGDLSGTHPPDRRPHPAPACCRRRHIRCDKAARHQMCPPPRHDHATVCIGKPLP